jgi:hypothetical protein
MPRTSSLLARLRYPFTLGLALAGLVGCAGSEPSADGTVDDGAALSAKEVNEAQGDFKEHVITAMAASDENRTSLGITTWDVFAGADAKSNFVGAVFYASDASGDVRYAFASNVKTGEVRVAVLAQDGAANADQRVDEAHLKQLMGDVARLRDALRAQRPSTGLHTQTEWGAPDGRVLACGVTVAYLALAGVAVGAVVIGAPAVVAGGFASAIMGSTFVAGGLYAGYQFIAALPEGLADDIGECL